MSKKKKIQNIAPEWPYPVDVSEIGTNPVRLSLAPTEAQRAVLASRLGVVSLDALEAELELARGKGSAVLHVTGRIRAKITQNCVITLEPVQSAIAEDFEAWFADEAAAVSFIKARHDRKTQKGPGGEQPVLDESEDPEPIIEGKIDAGELVTQHMILMIDLYPQKEGAASEIPEAVRAPEESEFRKNPFEALKDWKAKLGKENS